MNLASSEWITLVGQLLLSGAIIGLVNMLVSTSFWVIYATTRTFHLAHAVTYAIAGYVLVATCTWLSLPLWLGIFAAIIASIIFGVGVEYIVYRPLRNHGATVLGIFLASLGITIAGPNLLQIVFGPEVFRIPNVANYTISFGDITITTLKVISGVVSLLLVGAMIFGLVRLKIGRAINAVRTNAPLAMSVGIPINRVFMIAFAIGSCAIGAAGCLATLDSAASATMGLQPTLYGLIGIFLGGVATIEGAAIGGFLLGFLLVLSGLFMSPDLGIILVFVLLAAILIFKPEGLLTRTFLAGKGARS